jgi:hypothetical protein
LGLDDLKSKFGSRFLKVFDLLVSVPFLVVPHSFIYGSPDRTSASSSGAARQDTDARLLYAGHFCPKMSNLSSKSGLVTGSVARRGRVTRARMTQIMKLLDFRLF